MANKAIKESTKKRKPLLKKKTVPLNLRNPSVNVSGIKINIGSGVDCLDGYLNVDKYDSSADANWDIGEFPLHDNSVAQIVAYEVLEHLPINDTLAIFKEWHRVLKPKGNVIIIVPDIVNVCQQLVKNPEDEWLLAKIFGNQAHEGQFHKTGFTPKRITNLFGYAGFRVIKVAYIDGDINRDIYAEAIK